MSVLQITLVAFLTGAQERQNSPIGPYCENLKLVVTLCPFHGPQTLSNLVLSAANFFPVRGYQHSSNTWIEGASG